MVIHIILFFTWLIQLASTVDPKEKEIPTGHIIRKRHGSGDGSGDGSGADSGGYLNGYYLHGELPNNQIYNLNSNISIESCDICKRWRINLR